MGRGVNGGHPVLDVFIKQWPSLIFLPAILGLIVVLVAYVLGSHVSGHGK